MCICILHRRERGSGVSSGKRRGGKWCTALRFYGPEDGIRTGAHNECAVRAHQEAHRSSISAAEGQGPIGGHRVTRWSRLVLCNAPRQVFVACDKVTAAAAVEVEEQGAGLVGSIRGMDVLIIENT